MKTSMTLSLIVGLLVAFESQSSTLDSRLDDVALEKRLAQSSLRVLSHFDLALRYQEATGYLGFMTNISASRNGFAGLSPTLANEETILSVSPVALDLYVVLFFLRNHALMLNSISPNPDLQIATAAISDALLQAETTGNLLYRRESLSEILEHLATLRAEMKRISERSI
jgi:hypothetical protein